MTHVRIETSVPRHRKFLAAGPAASWLWLAGTCYANEGLTDGHIPALVLPSLGVAGAAKLAAKLVEVGLWDVDPSGDGWHIHDYLDHNRTAGQVKAIKQARAESGAKGGAKSWGSRKQSAEANDQQGAEPIDNDSTTTPSSATTATATRPVADASLEQPNLHQMLVDFTEAYDPKGRTSGHRTMTAWVDVFEKRPEQPAREVYAMLWAALVNHKASEQWTVKRMVPSLEKWLSEGRYLQRLDPPGVSGVGVQSSRIHTGGNVAALREFVKRHQPTGTEGE